MFKRKKQIDENTTMRNALVAAYENLSPMTQVKVDEAARAKGYSQGYLSMVQLFWKHKVYPYLARAYYGPQEGLVNFIEKIKGMFGRLSKNSMAPNADIEMQELSGLFDDMKNVDGAMTAFADIGKILASSGLKGEEAKQAVQDFLNDSAGVEADVSIGQRR